METKEIFSQKEELRRGGEEERGTKQRIVMDSPIQVCFLCFLKEILFAQYRKGCS